MYCRYRGSSALHRNAVSMVRYVGSASTGTAGSIASSRVCNSAAVAPWSRHRRKPSWLRSKSCVELLFDRGMKGASFLLAHTHKNDLHLLAPSRGWKLPRPCPAWTDFQKTPPPRASAACFAAVTVAVRHVHQVVQPATCRPVWCFHRQRGRGRWQAGRWFRGRCRGWARLHPLGSLLVWRKQSEQKGCFLHGRPGRGGRRRPAVSAHAWLRWRAWRRCLGRWWGVGGVCVGGRAFWVMAVVLLRLWVATCCFFQACLILPRTLRWEGGFARPPTFAWRFRWWVGRLGHDGWHGYARTLCCSEGDRVLGAAEASIVQENRCSVLQ